MSTVTIQEAFALAIQHHQAGRLGDAEALYRQILAVQPRHAEALHHLGVIARQVGRHDLAADLIQQAIALDPHNPAAHLNLGAVYGITAQHDKAIDRFRRALELEPDAADVYSSLGAALAEQGHFGEAVTACRRAVELQPRYADAFNHLGNALKGEGALEQAIAAYRQGLVLEPDHALMHSNLVYALHFHPDADGRKVVEEQQRWNQQFCAPRKQFILPHTNDRNPARRLRIGYVSPDFRSHPISFFLAPLLEAHDHRQCEIYCYANVARPDAVSQRLRKSADVWRDVRAFSEAQLAQQIRDDGIDILVDLVMHTASNLLPVFARKPAPVQISWLAYPGSAGVETIDYWLTDAHIEPAGEDDGGSNGQPVRLPDSWCCYAPIEEFPAVSPLPAAQSGIVTFGALNQFGKLGEGFLRCWARLLAALPASRLVMLCPEGRARERAHAVFAAQGVARERVEWVGRCSWAEYTRRFARIDVALDSFPCNGMTTTCHTLWMGVPVVTLAGRTPVSRAGSSLLHTVGLSEWVARSEEEYIQIATKWAGDLPRLGELRARLRPQMQASPLMNAPRFARNIETAYRTMWQRWCAEQQS